jgi:hypothetical protein
MHPFHLQVLPLGFNFKYPDLKYPFNDSTSLGISFGFSVSKPAACKAAAPRPPSPNIAAVLPNVFSPPKKLFSHARKSFANDRNLVKEVKLRLQK